MRGAYLFALFVFGVIGLTIVGCSPPNDAASPPATESVAGNDGGANDKEGTLSKVVEPKFLIKRTKITIEPREDVLREIGVTVDEFHIAVQQSDCVRALQEVLKSTDTPQPESFADVPIILAGKSRRLSDVAQVVFGETTEQ